MKKVLFLPALLFFGAISNLSADLVPLWDNLGHGEVEQKKFYMDKDRYEKLHEVSLSEENSMPLLHDVVETAKQELRRKDPDKTVSLKVGYISISPMGIKGKRLFYYYVRLENQNGEFAGSVYIAPDGMVVPSMYLSEWKRMADDMK
ncbi:hypothetical protein Rhal01_03709 [Rubritalea halochordaticola]|uniref:DUF3887 domain-containing protein n=1 Tax=Rubritalea halochordaticola TaxID=714537 RepID=A0ABP9V4B2_9BACT